MPVNGFGKVWRENANVRSRVGCPTDSEMAILSAAQQQFQGGYMFWRADTKTIYVFIGAPKDSVGIWRQYKDTWQDGDPTPQPASTPPAGLYAPTRGFGKIWNADDSLQSSLGWATEPESAVTGAWQPFERGYALWTPDRVIRFIYEGGNGEGIWERFADTYATPTPSGRE